MEPRLAQCFARRPRERRRRPGARDLAFEQLRDQRLGRRVGGIEDDQTEVAEQPLEPDRERIDQATAGRVGATQVGDQIGREVGVWQRDRQRVDDSVDLVSQSNGRGRGAPRRDDRQRHALEPLVGVEDAAAPDLIEVVVLRVHPEDGHRRHAVSLLDPSRQADGRDRLEQGVERSPEQSSLLPGHDRDRTRGSESSGRSDRRGGGAARPLLRLQKRRERRGGAGWTLACGNGVAPDGLVGRVAREERLERGEIGRVLGGQSRDPGKPSDVDGDGLGEGDDGTIRRHGPSLSQRVLGSVKVVWPRRRRCLGRCRPVLSC